MNAPGNECELGAQRLANWRFNADPESVDFVETLQRDDSQSLHRTSCNAIVLIDSNGALLRRYGSHQAKQALNDWNRWRLVQTHY